MGNSYDVVFFINRSGRRLHVDCWVELDPASSASLGDGTVLHLLIEGGAHHQDLRFASEKDPETVTAAKKWESDTIAAWLKAEEEEKEEGKEE